MEIHNDFKELLELFNAHKVEYLIVGGYALDSSDHPWQKAVMVMFDSNQ